MLEDSIQIQSLLIDSMFVYLPTEKILLTSQIKQCWGGGERGLRMINAARM